MTKEENDILNGQSLLYGDIDESFDFDELEEKLQSRLEDEFSSFEFSKEEKEKIGNPDTLGKVIFDEVWKQFGTQIGLDITNETLIQKYDREHSGESYEDIGKRIMQDQRYKDAVKDMKEQQQAGNLKDAYTGKNINRNDNANVDHVKSRKEIYTDPRRKQAGINTEELANKTENLKPTNESLNKSKGKNSIDEYIGSREEREKDLRKRNERANEKIDKSDMSDVEKRKAKEKNDKRLQDKLNADEELMKNADREARKAINKDINKGVIKESAKKVGKDALKQMAVSALFSLLKEVTNGFVRFLKSQVKSFQNFLEEMKDAIKAFFRRIGNVLQIGVSSVIGTVVNEIFEPIVSVFKKLASIIKQGVSSVTEAVRYICDKENKDKPFSFKVAEISKIITEGLAVVGAIISGEVFATHLSLVPGMQVEIPMLGKLSDVTGMFFASLVSGLAGAVIINLIDKLIAKQQIAAAQANIIENGNRIMATQYQIQAVSNALLERDKAIVKFNIMERHQAVAAVMMNTYGNSIRDFTEDFSESKYSPIMDEEDVRTINAIDKISNDVDDLLK